MNDQARILIVDDEEVVRRSHLRSLAKLGCHAEAVADGYEALKSMERRPFDVILLDLRMPGLDGMSVLKAIRSRWPESQVVVITGYPTIESAKEAVRLGAQNYVAKPVGPDDVIRAANEAWTQKRWAIHRNRNDREAHDLVGPPPEARPVPQDTRSGGTS